ncbi:MAG: hypothetical protein ACOX7P_01720 [Oscillospiraceae bacterium]|jgi:hypothetical protein
MKKRILAYRRKIDNILKEGSERDWDKLLSEHLVQISFFQHERLIHLIVTALFALIEVIAAFASVYSFSIGVFAVSLLALILLIPYVYHYFLLENEVHKLYDQYDLIARECEKCRSK